MSRAGLLRLVMRSQLRGVGVEKGIGVLRLRQSTRFASGLASLSMTVYLERGEVFRQGSNLRVAGKKMRG